MSVGFIYSSVRSPRPRIPYLTCAAPARRATSSAYGSIAGSLKCAPAFFGDPGCRLCESGADTRGTSLEIPPVHWSTTGFDLAWFHALSGGGPLLADPHLGSSRPQVDPHPAPPDKS